MTSIKEKKEALKRLKEVDPNMEAVWDEKIGILKRLRGNFPMKVEVDALSAARQFLSEHRAVYGLTDVDRELELKDIGHDPQGNTHIRLQQRWEEFEVFGAELIVHVAEDNTIRGVNGEYHIPIETVSKPSISADKAITTAKKHARKSSEIPGQETKLVVFHEKGKYTLCWHLRLDGMEKDKPALWEYFIDAKTAKVVHRYNNLQFHTSTTGNGRGRYAGCVRLNTYHNHSAGTYQLRDTSRSGIEIKTYDMDGSTNRDSLTLSADSNNRWTNTNRSPRRTSQEPEVDAHYYTGIVVDYFLNVHGRNSWDDAGSDAEVCMHYGINQTGSFWDPSRNRVYHPDGNGTSIDYKSSLDVVAHEFMHGVTQTSAALIYSGIESGALNESYSDFFASMIQEDWVFEEHIYLGATAPNDALRSLHDPTLYGQPDHYSNLGVGVHTNSGIPNKAGYLMTHGGTHHGIEVYGLGRDVTERIWYHALVSYLTPSSNFSDFRDALEDACDDLYLLDPWKKASVQNAMAAVGIGSAVSYPTCPTLIKPPCFLRLEPMPCAFRKEPVPCLLRKETTGGCCTRELILEPVPCRFRREATPCLTRTEVDGGVGGCCTRELILEPRPGSCEFIVETEPRICALADIPMFTHEGCQKEALILGRLTEEGRVEPLNVLSGPEGQPLGHVRILTRKP